MKKIFLVLLSFWSGNVFAAVTFLNHDYASYYQPLIESREYPKISLSESYGALVSESVVQTYSVRGLYNYYRNFVCDQIYAKSCRKNLDNLQNYAGLRLESSAQLFHADIESVIGSKMIYSTLGADGLSHQVSGALLVPKQTTPIKGIILFYHYTVLDKRNIPSNFNRDNFLLSPLLASSLVSAGYVVLAPDYLGFGSDESNVHPYVNFSEVNALSGIYMLQAYLHSASFKAANFAATPISVFISGYSEGGGYALWASKILQESNFLIRHNLELKKTIPVVGAYNISKVMYPFMFSNVTDDRVDPYNVENYWVSAVSKPGFYAASVNAGISYSQAPRFVESALYNANFMHCDKCVTHDQHLSATQFLESVAHSDGQMYNILFQQATASGYGYNKNSLWLIASENMRKDDRFIRQFTQADIYNWYSKTPVTLLAFEYDSVVPRLNSETAYLAMAAQGSPAVKLMLIPNQDFMVKGLIPLSDMQVDHPYGIKFMLPFVRRELELVQ